MGDNGWNGSKLTFKSLVQNLVKLQPKVGGADVDVSSDPTKPKVYVPGMDDISIDCTVMGTTPLARKEHGTVSIERNDGTTENFGGIEFYVSSVAPGNGQLDGNITSDFTLKPYGGTSS